MATPPNIAAILSNPLRRTRLLRALQAVVGRASGSEGTPEAHDNQSLAVVPPVGAGHGWILVADDNVVNQRLARRLIEKLGYSVDVAGNGDEAIQAFQRRAYNLVFMDCQMPIIDGFEATRRIRRLESPKRRTPVIAMTARAMRGDREECMASGMDDYISKPVKLAALSLAIERWSTAIVPSSAW
jgi:two-component system sensor histidine kinase/response regulator